MKSPGGNQRSRRTGTAIAIDHAAGPDGGVGTAAAVVPALRSQRHGDRADAGDDGGDRGSADAAGAAASRSSTSRCRQWLQDVASGAVHAVDGCRSETAFRRQVRRMGIAAGVALAISAMQMMQGGRNGRRMSGSGHGDMGGARRPAAPAVPVGAPARGAEASTDGNAAILGLRQCRSRPVSGHRGSVAWLHEIPGGAILRQPARLNNLSSLHPQGNAIDVNLYDPTSGALLPNISDLSLG